ncbi:4843_t:CDS:1, partial [Entrophospora sp. SA101]
EKEKVSSLETELNENDEILAKKNSEISRLVNDLAAAYSTISQLNKQIVNCEDELDEQEQDLTTAEEILADKNQKIAQNQVILSQEQANLLREKQDRQRTQNERDNYLAELHELEQDFSEQARLLADKNAKLAAAIAEKNDLQKQLTDERNLNQNLQNQINNHNCPAPAPHTCPIVNEVNCSHADYQEIKEQRDNYQQQAQTACQEKEEKEKQIIQQINQDLHLGLNNPSLKQVINRIQQLINKPPIYFTSDNGNLQKELDQANQTITRLEQELATNNTPFGENLETIKEIDLKGLVKELNIQLSPNAIQQMEQATNYQQLATTRNAEIKKHLQKDLNSLAVANASKEIIQPPNKERIILISCLVASLLTVGGLLIKLKKAKKNQFT